MPRPATAPCAPVAQETGREGKTLAKANLSVASRRGAAEMASATGEIAATRLGQYSWVLFEFARTPYVGLVYIFVFAPYFASTVVGDPVRGQEIWSLANTIVGVCIAVVAPFLGAISDRLGRRKPWILAFVLIMAPACWALWYAMPGAVGGLSILTITVLVIVLAVCFEFAALFHNAMLPSIAAHREIGWLSGLGLGIGNVGNLLAMVVILFGAALPASGDTLGGLLPDAPLFGLDPATYEHTRIAGPVSGVWLLLFTIPLMLWTPDRSSTNVSPNRAVREGLDQLWRTIQQARRISNVGFYLLARMLYNDGMIAILAYSGIYAVGTFGWNLTAIILFSVSLSPFSIGGGFIGGWLDRKFGAKRAIQIAVGSTCVALLGAVSITTDRIFFVIPYDAATAAPIWTFPYFQMLPEIVYIAMYMVLAVTVTAAFANSRTMMARIAPPGMMNQFFGLFAFSGTATAFAGHGIVTFFTRLSGSQQIGFGSVLLLLTAGFVAMYWTREERAADISRAPDTRPR